LGWNVFRFGSAGRTGRSNRLTTCVCAATGVLKGYDALMNLVLDEVEELLRGRHNPLSPLPLHVHPFQVTPPTYADIFPPLTPKSDDEGNEMTRPLGLVVVRGTLLVVVSPVDGSEVIANPFLQADED